MMSDSSDTLNKITDEQKEKTDIEKKREEYLELGLSGLKNIGNTCYMNSALQCLSASDLLTGYFLGMPNKIPPYKNDLKNGIMTALVENNKCKVSDLTEHEIRKNFKESLTYMLRKLLVIMWNENCCVAPKSFKSTLGKKNNMFMGCQQHDSQECLSFILDVIHEETKTDVKVNYTKMNEEQQNYAKYYENYLSETERIESEISRIKKEIKEYDKKLIENNKLNEKIKILGTLCKFFDEFWDELLNYYITDENTTIKIKVKKLYSLFKLALNNADDDEKKTICYHIRILISPINNFINYNYSEKIKNDKIDEIDKYLVDFQNEIKLLIEKYEGIILNNKNDIDEVLNEKNKLIYTCDELMNNKHMKYKNYVDNKKDIIKTDIIISYLFHLKRALNKNHSVINDIFTGLTLSEIKCKKCVNVSHRFDSYNILPLPIPKKIDKLSNNDNDNYDCNLDDCFDMYFNNEKLDGENQYSCEYCNDKVDAKKSTLLWSSPSRLIIQLKRFTDNNTRNNMNIDFPINNLDLSKYMSEYTDKDFTYDLYGVIMHKGQMNCGHYIAYTKNSINGKWYLFDDSNVLHIENEEVENKLKNNYAYVLFYKKNNTI
jgi:ubiquitin C-terminal hydrolase